MSQTAVCPGSFDPLTMGHYDIITRAAKIFGKVYVLIVNNSEKKYLLTPEQRLEVCKRSFSEFKNVEIILFSGMLADFIREKGNCVIVKGVRAMVDFDYENQLFSINKALCGCDTVFLPASPELSFVSSSFVRELIYYNKSFDRYIPKGAADYLNEIL